MNKLFKKDWLKRGWMELSVALLSFFCGIEGKQMQPSGTKPVIGIPQPVPRVQSPIIPKAQGMQKPVISTPIVQKVPQVAPVKVVQNQKTADRFTQTEAFLQLTRVRDLMMAESSSQYIPYLNIISDCLVKEEELKNSHYAFYHATGNEWRLAQDLYTQLYIRQNSLGKQVGETFSFLRFEDFAGVNAQEFLVNELKKNGLINDTGELAAILLSVNVSLFGNTGRSSSCTWNYFLTDMGHKIPDRKVYSKMMDKFGLTHKYIDELLSLIKLYDTKENTLLQIFVPQNKIDEIGYLAWSKGMPLHEGSIDWIKKYMRQKSWTTKKGKHVAEWAMEDLAQQFKKEQEKNPLFKDLIESVQEGDFSVEDYLKIYRNKPWEIPDINHTQVRLIFSADVLLNPGAGVEFYRYSTVSKTRLKEYYKRLNEIIDKIVAEKEGEENV
ncbi:MAG TPA: hypothetical protein VHX42_01735 [Candidatus Babeliales bacterium]|nr:hypothetical protein [Candidatus Babeliales bacterium]